MKRFALVAALLTVAIAFNSTPASARIYRRPVARATARVALPPYRPRIYTPYRYAPRVGVGVGVGVGVY